jgi:hypothetical protein
MTSRFWGHLRVRDAGLLVFLVAAVLMLAAADGAGAAVTAGVFRSPETSYVAAYSDIGGGVTVSVERAGVLVDTRSAPSYATVYVAAQVGDLITVLLGNVQVLQITFDGLPVFDASVCGVTSTFSGRRSAGSGIYTIYAFDPSSYHLPGRDAQGMVTSMAGDTFAGSFDAPVQPSWEAVVTTQQTIGSVVWLSGFQRFVGTCPATSGGQTGGAATSAATSLPDTTPPTGHLSGRLLAGGLRALLAGRATTTVVVGEAGVRIDQGVYLDNGARLPAQMASSKRPTLVARAHAVSQRAGRVTLRLRPTRKARVLRRRSRARIAIVTTLRDRAGNVRRLPVRRMILHRR